MSEFVDGAQVSLKDLYAPSARIYWSDLLLSAGLGWACFVVACLSATPWWAAPAMVTAVLLLYRAQAFLHELSHAARGIAGFGLAWNLLVGFPLLMPFIFAVGVHRVHHSPEHYGTVRDPEYLPLRRSRTMIIRFLAQCLILGPLMVLRWLVLGPIALLVPPLQREVERRVTSMAMNPAFIREVSREEHRVVLRQQLGALAFWLMPAMLLLTGIWPLRVVLCWLVLTAGIWGLTAVRSLVAHRYDSDGEPMDREGQIADSIDIPRGGWAEVWAPVGHRHHALHHMFPALPYHHLPAAYARLTQHGVPPRALALAASDGLLPGLRRLWSRPGAPSGAAR